MIFDSNFLHLPSFLEQKAQASSINGGPINTNSASSYQLSISNLISRVPRTVFERKEKNLEKGKERNGVT